MVGVGVGVCHAWHGQKKLVGGVSTFSISDMKNIPACESAEYDTLSSLIQLENYRDPPHYPRPVHLFAILNAVAMLCKKHRYKEVPKSP